MRNLVFFCVIYPDQWRGRGRMRRVIVLVGQSGQSGEVMGRRQE